MSFKTSFIFATINNTEQIRSQVTSCSYKSKIFHKDTNVFEVMFLNLSGTLVNNGTHQVQLDAGLRERRVN